MFMAAKSLNADNSCLITSQACNDLTHRLLTSGTIDEIDAVLADISGIFGYEQFMYGALLPTSFVQPRLFTISGYQKEWWDYYIENKYLAHDPVLRCCTQSTLPLYWREIDPRELEDPSNTA